MPACSLRRLKIRITRKRRSTSGTTSTDLIFQLSRILHYVNSWWIRLTSLRIHAKLRSYQLVDRKEDFTLTSTAPFRQTATRNDDVHAFLARFDVSFDFVRSTR